MHKNRVNFHKKIKHTDAENACVGAVFLAVCAIVFPTVRADSCTQNHGGVACAVL